MQPVDEQKNSNTNKTVSAERKYNLFVAVAAGPDQDEDLDDALFDMRVALLKDNRLLSLGIIQLPESLLSVSQNFLFRKDLNSAL